jgi:hypothetical protein
MLGGTGAISGKVTVLNGGHIAPGAGGIESLDVGMLTLGPTWYLDYELNTVAGIDIGDLLNVTAANGFSISSGGTLNITNAGTMTGGTYKLIDYNGALGGNVSGIAIGTAPAGFNYGVVNNAANTSIDLVVSMQGDFNSDDRVDAADYVVWRNGLGTMFTPADYDTWRANFGRTAAASATAAAVPEPLASLIVYLAVAIAALNVRSER